MSAPRLGTMRRVRQIFFAALACTAARASRPVVFRRPQRGLMRNPAATPRDFPAGSAVALAFAFALGVIPASAQTIIIDTFNSGATTGSIRAGSSWVGNVTQNATSITIGGTATDVNGWGATGLSLNATGMNFLTVTAHRDPGNAASKFAVQFEDQAVNTHVISVPTSAFAVGTPTQVQVPLPATSGGFSTSQIGSWSLGGGGLGLELLRLTLEALSFDFMPTAGVPFAPMDKVTYNGQVTGTAGLKLNGPGTLILGAANTFSGDVVLTQGTLELGAVGALPAGSPLNIAAGATLNLAGFAATLGKLEGAGSIALGAASLSVAQSSNSTYSGAITGTGGLAKSGSGMLTLTGTHTFTGPTSITGGLLRLNGSAANSAFMVSGGTLTGTGTVGPLTIGSGGTLSPGNSPGTLSAGSTTWADGGSFIFEINQASGGAAGSAPGWDILAITGSLTVTATSASKFTVSLNTFDFTSGAAGVPANFFASSNYTLGFVTTTTGIFGFDTTAFTLNTAGVDRSLTGTWAIAQSGNNLNLVYTGSAIPEPSTYAAIIGACALACAVWKRRRG